MEVGDENTWFTECLLTVAIVVYKGLKLVVYRMNYNKNLNIFNNYKYVYAYV